MIQCALLSSVLLTLPAVNKTYLYRAASNSLKPLAAYMLYSNMGATTGANNVINTKKQMT